MKQSTPHRNHNRAFTLIEVTIAMGIASFAILSMLGVMVVGMTTMRGAIDATVQAQITQNVVGSLKQSDFSSLSNSSALSWNYDDRGLPVDSTGFKVYGATVQVDPVSLSGGSPNPNLLRVIISISKLTEPGNPHVFSTFIANNGQ